MEFLSDSVVLSRMQFALTALFHMLWPVLTTGMGIYLVIVEGVWLKTQNPDYSACRLCRWSIRKTSLSREKEGKSQ